MGWIDGQDRMGMGWVGLTDDAWFERHTKKELRGLGFTQLVWVSAHFRALRDFTKGRGLDFLRSASSLSFSV